MQALKSQHKILAMLLAIMLVAGMMPLTVSASDVSTFAIVTHPEDATVTEGSISESLTCVAGSDDDNLSYVWYKNGANSTTGGNIVGDVGPQAGTLAIPNDLPVGVYYFYCVVGSEKFGTYLTSDIAKVTVLAEGGVDPGDPVIKITHQPTNTNVTVGEINNKTLSIGASATNDADVSFQWYENTSNSNTGGSAILDAISQTFTIPTDLAIGTYYYYCVVSANQLDSVTSTVATMTVSAKDTTPPSDPEPTNPPPSPNPTPSRPSSNNDDDDDRGSSGRGSDSSRGSSTTTSGPSNVTTATANSAVNSAIAAAQANGAANATANLRNPGDISLATLQSMANQAGDTALKVNADSINGNAVDVRITLDPAQATAALNLSASTVNADARNVNAVFDRFFSNDVMTVALGQQGSFGMPVQIAAKLDPTLNTENLVFYAYNLKPTALPALKPLLTG